MSSAPSRGGGPSLLVVDDDVTIRETLGEFFEALGYAVAAAGTATAARQAAARHAPDIALVDIRLPDADGITLLEALRADDPDVAVVMLTGHADVRTAVRAMQRGAVDFLEKPIDLEALESTVARAGELVRLRREVDVLRGRSHHDDATPRDGSPALPPTLDRLIELAARNADAPVLIVGETGTGKGFVARRIHERSREIAGGRDTPYVEINCASLSATFLESELFGHERGAFTDAKHAKRGLLEVAGRGTVFLDEIGELAVEVQPRLLKVLEERAFRRLGGIAELRTAARLIAATNQPLAERVAQSRFRADLYYRLQVLTISLSPLRDRPADIEVLARRLLPAGASLTADAVRTIRAYPWPGNVRELKNALWRAALLAEGRPIAPRHLGLETPDSPREAAEEVTLLAEVERRAIDRALTVAGGNRTRAAVLLGISRSTLFEKLKIAGHPTGVDRSGSV